MRRFAGNMVASGEADPAIDGILKDVGRNVAALCAGYLHVTDGLTLPALKLLITRFGFASPGRARALLLYLVYLGFVEAWPVRERGKPALYRPTARFVAAYRGHMHAVIDAMSPLQPRAGRLLERFEEPGVFEAFVRAMGDLMLDGRPIDHEQESYYSVFMHRHAGIQIMHSLLAESAEEAFPPMGRMAASASVLATRFRVSRVHVRRLLTAGETAGLLGFGEGWVELTQRGREAVDWVFATQIMIFLAAIGRTLAVLDVRSGGPGMGEAA